MDDSVIICENESPLIETQKLRILPKRKTKTTDTKLQVTVAKRYYESPLNHLKLSRGNSNVITSSLMQKNQKNGKRKRSSTNASDKRENDLKNRIDDSIIVVSDSETESSNTSTNVKTKKRKIEINSFEHDSNCLLISDSEVTDSIDSTKKQINKSSKQSQDDIIEVWSSVKTTEDDSQLFFIDKQPDSENLNVLTKDNLNSKCLPAKLNKNKKKVKNKKEKQAVLAKKVKAKKNKKRNVLTENITTPTNNNENSTLSSGNLREIIIDGCNVGTTCNKAFSEGRIKLVIDYFENRGHSVKVFIPQHKRSCSRPLLEKLFVKGVVVFTPSRQIEGKFITPYDDRFILEYATLCGGIVVSSDQYRDLYIEKPEWRDTIKNRLLPPTFVGNCVLFPQDPLGRCGPTLEQFLRH